MFEKKNIPSHEYKSIMDDAAKLQNDKNTNNKKLSFVSSL